MDKNTIKLIKHILGIATNCGIGASRTDSEDPPPSRAASRVEPKHLPTTCHSFFCHFCTINPWLPLQQTPYNVALSLMAGVLLVVPLCHEHPRRTQSELQHVCASVCGMCKCRHYRNMSQWRSPFSPLHRAFVPIVIDCADIQAERWKQRSAWHNTRRGTCNAGDSGIALTLTRMCNANMLSPQALYLRPVGR